MKLHKHSKAPALTTEAEGHQLALDMLDAMYEIGHDELCINGADDYREGRPQNDVLTRYLRIAQRHPAVEKGFLAVITDILGSAADCHGGDDYRGIVDDAEKGARYEQ